MKSLKNPPTSAPKRGEHGHRAAEERAEHHAQARSPAPSAARCRGSPWRSSARTRRRGRGGTGRPGRRRSTAAASTHCSQISTCPSSTRSLNRSTFLPSGVCNSRRDELRRRSRTPSTRRSRTSTFLPVLRIPHGQAAQHAFLDVALVGAEHLDASFPPAGRWGTPLR